MKPAPSHVQTAMRKFGARKANPNTTMSKISHEETCKKAILHLLDRIHRDEYFGWYAGLGTESFALLTEAYAVLSERPVESVREYFRPIKPRNPKDEPVPILGAGFPGPALADERFLKRMDRELVANQHKGDWIDWRPDRMTCLDELFHHLQKLQRALRLNDVERVTEHAADLANIASKTAEIHGDLEGK